MFERKTIDDIARIAAAGGGFRLDASRKTADDLALIASAAARGGARIIFVGLELRTIDEIARIAAAGKGAVSFE